jgi:hypothetical protein
VHEMGYATRPESGDDLESVIRQTSELRRLCLSLRQAATCETEQALANTFAGAVPAPSAPARLPARVLRAGFRWLWCQGRYAEILAIAQALPAKQLADDETVLMYTLCAAQMAVPHPRTASA